MKVDIETEVDLRMRLSRSLVEFELRLSWLTLNLGRNWAFIGFGLWFRICLRSTHIAKQHMFMFMFI